MQLAGFLLWLQLFSCAQMAKADKTERRGNRDVACQSLNALAEELCLEKVSNRDSREKAWGVGRLTFLARSWRVAPSPPGPHRGRNDAAGIVAEWSPFKVGR